MPRRSSRLELAGYYNSEGKPTVAYKETIQRFYRRCRTRPKTEAIDNSKNDNTSYSANTSYSTTPMTSYSATTSTSYSATPSTSYSATPSTSYSATTKTSYSATPSTSYSATTSTSYSATTSTSYNTIPISSYSATTTTTSTSYSTSHKYRNAGSNNSSSQSSSPRTISRNTDSDRDSNSRVPSVFRLRNFALLLLVLPLCFGVAYFIPALSRHFLDSGRSESPVSPTNENKEARYDAGYDAGYDIAKHLRELQDELRRLRNHMVPAADTLPNFALESLGACVIPDRSSETYQTRTGYLRIFGIPVWKLPLSPRTVIQGCSCLVPGQCWPFAGERGHLVIALSYPVTISHVTLGHVSKAVTPTGSVSSAPQKFSVYGMKTLDDEGDLLGTFDYDQDGDQVQTFKIPDHVKGVFSHVKLQVESNWGHPDFTCLYNFRVHGKLAD